MESRHKRQLVTALCLIGAVVCYFAGWGQGIAVLVGAGVLLELAFWVRLLGLRGAGRARRE